MKRILEFVAAAALGGCALYGGGTLEEGGAGVMRGGATAAAQVLAQVRPGTSSKAEVAAALGHANVVRFDSGWEVWVYRWPGADRSTRAATELIVLFDAAGVARKVRMRPGYSA